MPDAPPTPPSFLSWILKLAPGGVSSLIVFGVLAYFGWNTDQPVPWYAWLSAAGIFVAVRFGQKIWEKVESDAVDGTVHFVRTVPGRVGDVGRGLVRWITDRTASHYLAGLVNRFGLFNDKGLGLINANRLDLERIYVDLRTAADVNLTQSQSHLIARAVRSEQPFWVFVRAARPGIAFAVIGPPGSGKTTLIHHVVLTYARRKHRRHGVPFRIPILIELRTIADFITEKKPALAEVAERAVRDLIPRLADVTPVSWFDKRLTRGQCTVLFDGLDEISDRDKRKAVSKWLDEQINGDGYRDNLFVVTSRPAGYKSAPLDRAQALEVQPFTQEQSRKFIDNWYVANEIVSSGNQDNQTVRERAQDGADHLHKALRDNPRLNDLTTNPLLLTMIVMVHRYHGALPGSRVQLYAEVCQVLLERWRQARDIKDDKYTAAQKLTVLKPLAAHMMSKGVREISEADALAVMSTEMDRINVGKTKRSEFMHNLQAGSGLLLEKENGVWGFAHHSFQEYLTAEHWGKHPPAEDTWAKYVGEPWWRETLLLYAAQNDASHIVSAALDVGTPQSLAFAFDCEMQALSVSPGVRERLKAYLHDALKSRDPAVFNPAAEAWFVRCEQDYTKLDDTTEISTRLVTQAEYQLFLNETEHYAYLYHPPHWNRVWFEGDPQSPVAGLTSLSAESYCQWLIRRRPFVEFRLPSPKEHAEAGISGTTLSVWTQVGNAIPHCAISSEILRTTRERFVQKGENSPQWEKSLTPFDINDLASAFLSTSGPPGDLMRDLDRDCGLSSPRESAAWSLVDLIANEKRKQVFHQRFYGRPLHHALDLAITFYAKVAVISEAAHISGRDTKDKFVLEICDAITRELSQVHDIRSAFPLLIDFVAYRSIFLPVETETTEHVAKKELEDLDSLHQELNHVVKTLLQGVTEQTKTLVDFWVRALSARDLTSVRREIRRFWLEVILHWEDAASGQRELTRSRQIWGLFASRKDGRTDNELVNPRNRFEAFLLLTLAREAGNMPVWEGLRVVRMKRMGVVFNPTDREDFHIV